MNIVEHFKNHPVPYILSLIVASFVAGIKVDSWMRSEYSSPSKAAHVSTDLSTEEQLAQCLSRNHELESAIAQKQISASVLTNLIVEGEALSSSFTDPDMIFNGPLLGGFLSWQAKVESYLSHSDPQTLDHFNNTLKAANKGISDDELSRPGSAFLLRDYTEMGIAVLKGKLLSLEPQDIQQGVPPYGAQSAPSGDR